MIKRNDVILIGAILVLTLVGVLAFNMMKSNGSKVVITVDGKEYKTLDLATDTTINMDVHDDEHNIVEIKDGKVTMVDANCPDKLCVKHRSIQYNHETIVCLPHKIVLEIVDGEESEVDIIAK